MTTQFATTGAAPYPARFADAFVIFSVTVLSLAIGAWFLLQLKLALWTGMVAALAIYTALLSVHLVMRRSFMGFEGALAEVEDSDTWQRADLPAAAEPPLPDDVGGPDEGAFAPPAPLPPAARKALGDVREPKRASGGLPPPRAADPFDYRPKGDPALPRSAPAGMPPVAAARDRVSAPSSGVEGELSAEVIQDLIKKLADELNGATAADRPGAADELDGLDQAEAMVGGSVATLQRAGVRPTLDPPAARAPAPAATSPSSPDWWPRAEVTPGLGLGSAPAPSAPPSLNPQLSRIAEAVAAERMEVMLEPIHALAEGRPRHFEISVRLRTADGHLLEQRDLARVAQGTGLMPRIDAARMIRAARVAWKLGERGRQGSVLTAASGESLTDESFLDAASEPGSMGRMSLLLSFAQSEVRAFTPGHIQALGTMAKAGVGFALDEIADLDMDFAQLKTLGFQFVKLDAPAFLEGLGAAGSRVPASDICRHLADFGLTVIVGRIEDDWLLARILGFGVLFGKGALFGGPRQVKEEVVAGARVA